MKKVYFLSILLLIGLVLSQIFPQVFENYKNISHLIKVGTIICLAFIMIHVGYEFEIRKDKIKEYGYDYLIAFSAATLPWIFVTFYFVYILTPVSARIGETWVNSLLAARFSAPTSAGVLFSMLAAAGLSSTWMFKKTRILAIFDDLDTVMLMIPLQMLIIGFKIQLLFVLVVMFVLVWLSWKYLNAIHLSIRWKNVLFYSILIAGTAEIIYFTSKTIDETVGVHIEVLLPAFVLGTMISKNHNRIKLQHNNKDEDILELKSEKRTSFIVSSVFMLLVGLSMPVLEGFTENDLKIQQIDKEIVDSYFRGNELSNLSLTSEKPINWGIILIHVIIVTLISNIGKIVPAFVYRNEATWRERLSVAIAMFPRGEVGAGVLIISISYGIGGIIVTVSMLSLALNLILTGLFIVIVKRLLKTVSNTQIHA